MSKVAEKIMADAGARIQEINAGLRQDEAALLKKHELDMKSAEKESGRRLDELYNAELNRLKALGDLHLKMEILKAKNSIIDELMIEMKTKLKSDPAMYANFIESMIMKGALSGSEEIIISEEDRAVVDDKFIDAINSKLSKDRGTPFNLHRADETRETGGGIYLREGNIEYNGTINESVKYIFDNFRMDIGGIFFSDS